MNELVNLIIQYGVYPVIMAALIIVFVTQGTRDRKANKQNYEILKTDLKDFVKEQIKIIAPTEHTPEEEDTNREVNDMINTKLANLLIETNANRACYYSFHNGGKDITGRSYQKMSITNEQDEFNTMPIIAQVQNIPRASLPYLFTNLNVSDGFCSFADLDKGNIEDAVTCNLFKTHGAKAACVRAVYGNQDMMIGFIVLEFFDKDNYNARDCKEKTGSRAEFLSGVLLGKPKNAEANN